MTLFWNRKNEPIEDTLTWARMYEDDAYRTVAIDADFGEGVMVSTIWEGLDRGLFLHQDGSTALIFETAYLFNGYLERTELSHTEEEALAMHAAFCRTYLARDPRPEDGLVEKRINPGGGS